MDYSEKWGKDVDEAVRLAMDDLGVTEEQVTAGHVMVTVLEEPTKGFLGLGSKLAKVRVEKIQVDAEEEAKSLKENSFNHVAKGARDLRKKNKGQGQGGAQRQSSGRQERPNRQGRPERMERQERQGRPDRQERPQRQNRPGMERNRPNFANADDSDLVVNPNKPSLSERPENLQQIEDNEASLFLKDIVGKMGLDVGTKVYKNDECIFIEIDGPDSRTVIGKRGQTLDSIQYLTNLVMNKDREEYIRVIIDVEGYRTRREKTLERLALKLAKKVQKSGRSVRLEPMNPYERKVIHATIQDMNGVTTRSEGEEPYRRVIIDRK